MIVSLSGTPGTGKTSAAALLDKKIFEVVSVKSIAGDYITSYDEVRGSSEVDIAHLNRDLEDGRIQLGNDPERHTIVEGHLSHLLPVDMIIVLRASTNVIEERLEKRGYPDEKIRENMEAEALGVISLEALDSRATVFELDTTRLEPVEVASRIREIIESPSDPLEDPAEMVDYSGEIMEWY